MRLYMKVAVEHKCDLIAISHLDIDAILYESRRGAQLRPNYDIALGYECDIKTNLYESHQKHSCDLIATSHWDINAT